MPDKPKRAKNCETGTANGSSQTAYPLWARILVAAVITAFAAIAVFFTIGLNASVQNLKKATNPAYISEHVSSFIHIDEPLPQGFKYTFCGEPFGVNLLSLVYLPDSTVFVLGTKAGKELNLNSAREIVDNPESFGLPRLYGDMKVESKGAVKVADESLEYVSGTADEHGRRSGGAFIGSSLLKNKSVLIVYAFTPRDLDQSQSKESASTNSFNMQAALKFFAAVKGF